MRTINVPSSHPSHLSAEKTKWHAILTTPQVEVRAARAIYLNNLDDDLEELSEQCKRTWQLQGEIHEAQVQYDCAKIMQKQAFLNSVIVYLGQKSP